MDPEVADAPEGSGAAEARPKLLITIDTEEDNAWARTGRNDTRNATYLQRFQALCEAYGFKPTYLANYPMAVSGAFREFGRDAIGRGAAEIGMHLHAWNTPNGYRLTDDDSKHHPYLIEYPEAVLRDMVARMTDELAEAFARRPVSHRAGRWAFDAVYARALIDHGYEIDCSVTPHVSWQTHKGRPDGPGGTDYTGYPEEPYYVDPEDTSRPGHSPLLEVPMTIVSCRCRLAQVLRQRCSARSLVRRAAERLWPEAIWFRPDGRNLGRLLKVLRRARAEGRDYVQFMLHSSELMPGGSPKFPTEADIDQLYDQLNALFEHAGSFFTGATLEEYARAFRDRGR